jgi:hypothetical protein
LLKLRIQIADLNVQLVQSAHRSLIGIGTFREPLGQVLERLDNGASESTLEKLLSDVDDANLIHVIHPGGHADRVVAYRSILSNRDLYYFDLHDSVLLITDSFRNVLANIPVAEREINERAISDLVLFRTTPPDETYLIGLGRLGHGVRREWDSAGARESIVDRLGPSGSSEPFGPQEIENFIRELINEAPLGESKVNLLSGGVDSTLLQTYLSEDFPSVSIGVDSAEFADEVGYARRAVSLLNNPHREIIVPEVEYLDVVSDAIESCCLPPHHVQVMVPDTVMRDTDYRDYLSAEFADITFGLPNVPRHEFTHRLRGVGILLSTIGADAWLPGELGAKAGRLVAFGRSIRAPVDSWEALGASASTFTEMDRAKMLLGETEVRNRIERRAGYVAARFSNENSPAAPLYRHIEFSHVVSLLCEETIVLWRQMAMARGKSLQTPFASNRLFGRALDIPVEQRYARKGEAKFLLKGLLARRLPGFDVGIPKRGGLPIERWFESGPFRHGFETYGRPDFLSEQEFSELNRSGGWLRWTLLTYVIWKKLCIMNPSISLCPETQVFEYMDGAVPVPPETDKLRT